MRKAGGPDQAQGSRAPGSACGLREARGRAGGLVAGCQPGSGPGARALGRSERAAGGRGAPKSWFRPGRHRPPLGERDPGGGGPGRAAAGERGPRTPPGVGIFWVQGAAACPGAIARLQAACRPALHRPDPPRMGIPPPRPPARRRPHKSGVPGGAGWGWGPGANRQGRVGAGDGLRVGPRVGGKRLRWSLMWRLSRMEREEGLARGDLPSPGNLEASSRRSEGECPSGMEPKSEPRAPTARPDPEGRLARRWWGLGHARRCPRVTPGLADSYGAPLTLCLRPRLLCVFCT